MPEIESVWPEIERRLRGYLHRRGCAPDDAQDITQEVALKLLVLPEVRCSAEELMPWCLTVARNLHVDRHRQSSRFSFEESTAAAAPDDVEWAVEQRLRLASTLRCMTLLKKADQEALRPVATAVQRTRKEAVRDNVRRLRARERLLRLVESGAALVLAMTSWRPRPTRALPVAAAMVIPLLWLGVPAEPGGEPLVDEAAAPHVALLQSPWERHDRAPVAAPLSQGPQGRRLHLREDAAPPPLAARATVVDVAPVPGVRLLRVIAREKADDDALLCVGRAPVLGELCLHDDPDDARRAGAGGAAPVAPPGDEAPTLPRD